MIYLSLTQDKDSFSFDHDRTNIGMVARNARLPAMLRVTRQFSIEYQDTLEKHSELQLFDRGKSLILPPVFLSRDLSKYVSKGSIYLLVYRTSDLQAHVGWIQGLQAVLQNFSRLHVVLFICTPDHLRPYEPVVWPCDINLPRDRNGSHTLLADITPLLQVLTITSVEVRFAKRVPGVERSLAAIDPEYYQASTLYGCWSKTDGWAAPKPKE